MQEELPYEPLTFIKTGTIGGSGKEGPSRSGYDFKHHHILQPRGLPSPRLVLYLLFHSAPVYNWLVTVPTLETTFLNDYIINSRPSPLSLQVDITRIISDLNEYAKRWQVAKIVFSSKVYVIQVREHGSHACTHLPKTEQLAVQLSYDRAQGRLHCPSLLCRQCNRTISVECNLKGLASAFVSTFGAPLLVNEGVKYEAWVVYCKKKVFIKSANKIWYSIELSNGSSRMVGINNVEFKEAVLVGYCLQNKEQGALIKAVPIKDEILGGGKVKNDGKQGKLAKGGQHGEEPDNNATSSKQRQQDRRIQPQLKLPGKMKALKYDATQVLVPAETPSSSYVRQVQAHLQKPKQKDSYELDYDRGKLKKKKEKRQYIHPDFNEIFEQVKRGGVDIHSKKIKKKERREREPESDDD